MFDDVGNDGTYNAGTDLGIPNISVNLYEDTNGNGVIDAGDALVATTSTDANGLYSFTGLAEGLDYLVQVDAEDPDLYLGKAYYAAGPARIPVGFFVLERLRRGIGEVRSA